MRKFENYFTDFIVNTLKVLLTILLLGTIVMLCYFYGGIDTATILLMLFYSLSIFVIYKTINSSKLKISYKIYILISLGILARLLWIININTLPYSDFNTMYTSAEDLVNGNNSGFTGYSYFARFPHLSLMVVYISIFLRVFTNALLALKIGNLILSIISICLVYKIVLEIFNNKKLALISIGICSLFPPMITYVGVLATENIAIPFYLASVYAFVLYSNRADDIRKIISCGILLGIGNLFRMVATVMLIAYVIYVVAYMESSLKLKIKGILSLVGSFFLILFLVSGLLKATNITEVDLWKGREPAITNILKGTNFESWGRFNSEDAAIPEMYNYDYERVSEASRKIIIERLTNASPFELVKFYGVKFVGQWVQGDMSGVSWSESGAENIKYIISDNAKVVFQVFYVFMILLSLVSLFNKNRIKKEGSIINLFYIILCGYGAFYLITEMQGRYAYIVCWLFIIFAVSGIEKIIKYKTNRNLKNKITKSIT